MGSDIFSQSDGWKSKTVLPEVGPRRVHCPLQSFYIWLRKASLK